MYNFVYHHCPYHLISHWVQLKAQCPLTILIICLFQQVGGLLSFCLPTSLSLSPYTSSPYDSAMPTPCHPIIARPVVKSIDEEPRDDSSDKSELSVVKIVSDDPWAVIWVAAIAYIFQLSYSNLSFLILSAVWLGGHLQELSLKYSGITYLWGSVHRCYKCWYFQISIACYFYLAFIWLGFHWQQPSEYLINYRVWLPFPPVQSLSDDTA